MSALPRLGGAFAQAADADEIRSEAEQILSHGKYRPEEPTLLDRALQWVGGRFDDLFGAIGSAGLPGGYLIGYLVLAALGVVIVWLAVRFWPARRGAVASAPASVSVEAETTRSRQAWLEAAREAAAAGDWPAVVNARWRALTAGLAERGDLPERTTLTALESASTYEGTPPRRAALRDGADRFRDVRYGGAEATESDDAAFVERDEFVLSDRADGA